jgi:two-component system OmpR family sensor kinase
VWGIGSLFRRRWLEIAWGVFAAANLVTIVLFTRWETIPFHFIWVSLTLLYGSRVWGLRATVALVTVVSVLTAGALIWTVTRGHEHIDEVAEVPLMAAMFVAMMWHARRTQRAMEDVGRLAESEHRLHEREREFVRDASHELRTPITIARGHAELIRSAAPEGQAGADAEVILDELSRLTRVSDRLLILTAATHPDFLRRNSVHVEPFIVEIVKRWSAAAARRWQVEVGTDGEVDVDKERLRLALDALIENAVEHTGEDDGVTVIARADRDALVIEVSDTGQGIPDDHLERIFDRFARADGGRSRDRGGTGLGLAIVKALVEAHGGSVSAESRVGAGSRFRIRLPGFTPSLKVLDRQARASVR